MTSGTAPSAQHNSVWGRVVDPLGGHVQSPEVFWIDAEHAGKESVSLLHAHKVAQADQDGQFWAPDLPAGPCILVPDYQRMQSTAELLLITGGTALTIPPGGIDHVTVVFPYKRTDFGTLTGVITDELDTRPASRLHLALADETGTKVFRETDTHTNGAFEFRFLPPGKYNLTIWGTLRHPNGVVPLELARNKICTVTLKQRRRPPGPRTSVRVHVESFTGEPVSRARVHVTIPLLSLGPQLTDYEGLVEIRGLPERPIGVQAMASGFWPDGAAVPPGGASDPAEVKVVLQRAVKLRVAVQDAGNGRALRHANLLVTHSGGDYRNIGGVLPPPNEPARDHEFVDVRPGEVVVSAECPGYRRGESRIDVSAVGEDFVPVMVQLEPRS